MMDFPSRRKVCLNDVRLGAHAPQRGRALRACTLLAALCALGCAGASARDQARLGRLRSMVEDVVRAGAYVCAPHELALSQANLEFAQRELEQGDSERAAEHMLESEQNAGAARILSPSDRCQVTARPVPELYDSVASDRDADGVADDQDGCPDEPEDADGYLDADGCNDVDDDADGVRDDADQCPRQAEDLDGVLDDDGCADLDDDADGMPDDVDACPHQVGSVELQGCERNEYPQLIVDEKELRLIMPIEFEAKTRTIRSVSFATLDAVVAVLRERPRIALEIAAHTDSQGDSDGNLRLSQDQADAVARYLIERGVEASRLTARGYGDTRPIESNSTSRGRAINRRLELFRLDRAP
jgi:OmpA-OmpF porin, OOP family